MRCLFFVFLFACSQNGNDPAPVTPQQIKDASGNVYKTIEIGKKTWLDRNLITTKFLDGMDITTFGDGYYSWFTVNNAAGICPNGFRVPTIEELNTTFEKRGYWDASGIVSNGIGYYWSASEISASEAMARVDQDATPYPKDIGICVRCIKK